MRRDAQHKELAMERIERLFSLASGCFTEDPQLANRYVELARNIGMRCQVRIPAPLKMRFCRRCGAFLTSGSNSRVRIRPDGRGRVVVTCLKCGTIKHYPMIREKLQRRENVTD